MKLTTLLINKLIIKTTLDSAMLVVAHTLDEIAMNLYATDAVQTWTAIHLPNALKRTPNRQQKPVPLYINNNSITSQSNGHYDPSI